MLHTLRMLAEAVSDLSMEAMFGTTLRISTLTLRLTVTLHIRAPAPTLRIVEIQWSLATSMSEPLIL